MPTASARDFKPLTWPRWTRIKAIIFPPVSDQNACDVTIDADYNVCYGAFHCADGVLDRKSGNIILFYMEWITLVRLFSVTLL